VLTNAYQQKSLGYCSGFFCLLFNQNNHDRPIRVSRWATFSLFSVDNGVIDTVKTIAFAGIARLLGTFASTQFIQPA
jgi:hypothetical protein